MKENQIDKQAVEEMAEDIKEILGRNLGKTNLYHWVTKDLYNKGYRRQSVGEWVIEGVYLKTMKCSVCDNTANSIYDKTPFCPKCGARMYKQTDVKDYPPYLDRPKMKGGAEG